MIGNNGKDLIEYLISANWSNGRLYLKFKLDAAPYLRTDESVTIASKSFPVISMVSTEECIIAYVRGKKFELIHFKRLGKCQS